MNKLISVFVCGVQKGGTTSLDAHFAEHPELSPPRRKELHYFDNEKHDWSKPNYTEIANFFKPADGQRLRYDITPIYCFWPPCVARLKAYNPEAKLIMIFRDPFERAWSQWCMEYARKTEPMAFAAAIREGRKRLDGLPPLAAKRRVFTYVERGLYGEQVRRVLESFPREQVLFLRSDEFARDHAALLAQVSSFLGIAPFPDTGAKRRHTRPALAGVAEPTAADLAHVAKIVHDDLLEFSKLTGLSVVNWPCIRGSLSSASNETAS